MYFHRIIDYLVTIIVTAFVKVWFVKTIWQEAATIRVDLQLEEDAVDLLPLEVSVNAYYY